MPDLNLDEPAVREEIAAILRFWLEEVGADGFRLEAVRSYYTGDAERCITFPNWLADTARAIRPDCFPVAEAWTDLNTIARYSESRVDGFFCFPVSQAEGYIAKMLARANRRPGRSYGEYTALLEETLPAGTVPAPSRSSQKAEPFSPALRRGRFSSKNPKERLFIYRILCYIGMSINICWRSVRTWRKRRGSGTRSSRAATR